MSIRCICSHGPQAMGRKLRRLEHGTTTRETSNVDCWWNATATVVWCVRHSYFPSVLRYRGYGYINRRQTMHATLHFYDEAMAADPHRDRKRHESDAIGQQHNEPSLLRSPFNFFFFFERLRLLRLPLHDATHTGFTPF